MLLRYILLAGCSWITVLLINYFHSTIALFTAASIFAVLLNYPVVWLSRYLPRRLAIALRVVAVSIVLIQTQDNYIRPKVMEDALELNPVLLFLALFIGERIAGLLGVFLSIPIAGFIALWL